MTTEIKRIFQATQQSSYANAIGRFVFSEILKSGPIPRHIGLIMDGNRRFAKRNKLPTIEGHKKGAENLIAVLETCYRVGIPEVTIYAFSIENFSRPQDELDDFFEFFSSTFEKLPRTELFTQYGIRVRVIGNKSLLTPGHLAKMTEVEELTRGSESGRILNVCVSYTSRDEISRSIKSTAWRLQQKLITKDDIMECTIAENFDNGDTAAPLDLLIRTSGHKRLSDFLLWQCTANCRIFYLDTLWPDFGALALLWVLYCWSFDKTRATNSALFVAKPDAAHNLRLHLLPPSPPVLSVSKAGK